MSAIEVPKFWLLRLPCTCPFGSLVADQRPSRVVATEEAAWDEFYKGQRRRMNADRKSGCYVTPVDDFDPVRWMAGHDHPECTRAAL